MIMFLCLVTGLVVFGLGSYLLKRQRLKRIQAMFLRFHDQDRDLEVIVSWIEEKRSQGRMLEVLDYLSKIEEEALAVEVLERIGTERFPHRHILMFACRGFLKTERKEAALQTAKQLRDRYPDDDSIRDLFIDVHLHYDELDAVRDVLMPRLERKFKGTIFPRHYARLLAAEGNYQKAVTIMQNVVEKEQALYTNTFAQPQKSLIGVQCEESKNYLERFLALRDGESGTS